MNILIIGLGSIGKRHLENILAPGHKKVSAVTRQKQLCKGFEEIQVYVSIDEAFKEKYFDTVFICTPTSHHINDLKIILQHDVQRIYLEKPVSNNYNDIDETVELLKTKKTKITVGYDLRFDPGLQKVKELLSQNVVGKPLSVNATVGQYLPDWRPHEDYTKGTSAKKETGGGVMLDLVHEFDYMYWLMGNVQTVAAQKMNSKTLEIGTEDIAEVLLKFDSGAFGSIHLDYLQPTLVRNCRITASDGSIFWDMVLSEVKWINRAKEEFVFSYKGFERNDRFKQITTAFLEDKNDDRLATFEDGIKSLQMVLAAKHSAEENKFIELENFNFQ